MKTGLRPAAILSAAALTLSAAPVEAKKFFLLGVDGCDPNLLQQYMDEGRLPNFKRLAEKGSFLPLGTTMPPQSPVAWSTVITGTDPGGHGIFDFIHRHPESYYPYLSTSEARPAENTVTLFGYTLTIPGYTTPAKTVNLRGGVPFWDHLVANGIETMIFKMPANYPPSEMDGGRAISDMGTPDILGTYGTFSYWTTKKPKKEISEISGGNVNMVRVVNNKVECSLAGPPDPFRAESRGTEVDFTVRLDPTNPVVTISIGDERVLLREGEWSEWVPVTYEFSLMQSAQGIVRFYLQEVRPDFRLYASPVNFDPCNDIGSITTPPEFAEDLCENLGRFYTQGMPEETKGLEGLVFEDSEFVKQRRIVFDERRRQLDYVLDEFRAAADGMTFFYFGSIDQTAHMMWRTMDDAHPGHRPEDEAVRNTIRETYELVDPAIGAVLDAVEDEGGTMVVVSDHGFSPWYRSFHLNTWLLENGYLAVKNPNNYGEGEFLSEVDFWKTKAYAIGINSLYINERGREGRGTVAPGAEKEALMEELIEKLEATVDPETGRRCIKKVYRRDEIYHGPYVDQAPDLIIGYDRGYRGSDESAKGQVVNRPFVENNMKKWSGDHCMAHDVVPGVVLANRKITKPDPELADIAPTVLKAFGIPIPEAMNGKPIF